MTPDEFALDSSTFCTDKPCTDKPRILYRYARKKYANLSGSGAALSPGLLNWLGEKAVYTSTEKGVPILERLVHTPKESIPRNLAMMEILLSGQWVIDGDWKLSDTVMLDPNTGARMLVCSSLLKARLAITTPFPFKPIALAVPSVIVPVWNLVLYPHGMAFRKHIRLKSVTSFEFDPRLFPEDAEIEEA